jgi:hypothetical protein
VKWFRFYHEVLDDPKVQDLEPAVFKHWVNLLCLANAQEPRGTLPDNPRFIAFRLRIRDATAAKLIAELVERGLLERDEKGGNCRLIPHNWEKRQAKSDDSAPRVAQSRANSPEKNRVNVTADPPLLKRANSSLEGEGEEDSSPTEKRARASGAVAPAPHQAVVNAWMAAVGRDPERAKDYGRYVAVGAEMAGRGDTPQDVGNCTRYLATDPWRQEKSKAPALTDVRDALPMWRDSGRPARVATGPRPNGKPPSGQEYLMRQLALVRQQSERSEEQQRGPDGPRRLPGGPVQAGRHAE